MTKNDLIKKLQEELKTYSLKDVTYAVDIIFDSMTDAIKRGERIELRGFGSFVVRKKTANGAKSEIRSRSETEGKKSAIF